MPAKSVTGSISMKWVAGDLCVFIIGIAVRLALASPKPSPIFGGPGHLQTASRLAQYLFNPLMYTVVVALLVFRIFRLKFAGFWSIFFSFIAGGTLATIFLAMFK